MNDEIKEILDTLQECVDSPLNEFYYPEKVDNRVHMNSVACKVLLDYIINLQNENEKLSKQHLVTIDKLIETQEKIEKAIEYIEKLSPCMSDDEGGTLYITSTIWGEDLLDILNGRSDK